MNARTPRPVVTVAEPGELVSAVPYLVGFTPQRSVVVVSLRGAQLRCGVVARADLPGTEQPTTDEPPTTDELVDQLVGSVLRDGPEEVVLLVYDDPPFGAGPAPHQDLISALGDGFRSAQVAVKDVLYVTADRFWSYRCDDPDCCPVQGRQVAHVVASPVAATLVAHGRAPLPTREDLRRRVRARGPVTSAAVAEAASSERARRAALAPPHRHQHTHEVLARLVVRRLSAMGDGPSGTRPDQAGGSGASVAEAAAVLAGLAEIPVRDAVILRWTSWLLALPPEVVNPDDLAAAQSWAGRLEALDAPDDGCRATGFAPSQAQLWDQAVCDVLLDLATTADGELAVPALVLLAMQAWTTGEGALANVAVERALRLDPDYALAHLVDQLLCRGIAPRWVGDQRAAEDQTSHPSG